MEEKKLYKSRTDRKICGVCGGLGKYFGIDSNVVRLIAVVVGLLAFAGVIAYIVAAAILPDEPEGV